MCTTSACKARKNDSLDIINTGTVIVYKRTYMHKLIIMLAQRRNLPTSSTTLLIAYRCQTHSSDMAEITEENWEQRLREIAKLVAQNERDAQKARQVACAPAVSPADVEERRSENARLLADIEAARATTSARRASYLAKARIQASAVLPEVLRSDNSTQSHSQHQLMQHQLDTVLPCAGAPMPRANVLATCTDTRTRCASAVQLSATQPASTQPLVYVMDSFLTAEECDHLLALGNRQVKLLTKMRPLLQAMADGRLNENVEPGGMIEWRPQSAPDSVALDVEERIGVLMGVPPHSKDGGIKLAQTRFKEGHDAPGATRVPDGAHVDTNRHEHRWGTCIIYLSDFDEADGGICVHHALDRWCTCADGSCALTHSCMANPCACLRSRAGETCFPLASVDGQEPLQSTLVDDASLLVCAGCLHTEIAYEAGQSPALVDAADRLLEASESTARGERGLVVRPRKGRVCVFYTRGIDGEIDPRSFHFGAAVRTPQKDKWTCQIFKALPEGAREAADERRAFLQAVHPLMTASSSSDS